MICYTDGACRGNGKDSAAGGFGVVVLDDNQNIVDLYSKQCEGTTNNREELKAILYVMLKYGKKEYNFTIDEHPPVVYSDSAYCVNTFNDWMFRWANNGWVKSDKKIPENLDLVKEYYNSLKKIDLRHIKGHAGHKYNELADKLATGKVKPDDIIEVIS